MREDRGFIFVNEVLIGLPLTPGGGGKGGEGKGRRPLSASVSRWPPSVG